MQPPASINRPLCVFAVFADQVKIGTDYFTIDQARAWRYVQPLSFDREGVLYQNATLWLVLFALAGEHKFVVEHQQSEWKHDGTFLTTRQRHGLFCLPITADFPMSFREGGTLNQYRISVDGNVIGVAYIVGEVK